MIFGKAGLVFLASQLALVASDVSPSLPKDGALFSASGGSAKVEISWIDDGSSDFPAKDIKTQSILLCTGPNLQIDCYKTPLTASKDLTDSDGTGKYTATIDAAKGPNGYYYFQIYTLFNDGGNTIHYTRRFKLLGMSGLPDPTFAAGAYDATGSPPQAQLSGKSQGKTAAIDSASFTVPYAEQSGETKFAPMQLQPGSTVTATTWTRKYELLAVTYFTTKGPKPVVMTTLTPGWSYTPESATNWALVAPYPTAYYPALERAAKATLAPTNKKRWL